MNKITLVLLFSAFFILFVNSQDYSCMDREKELQIQEQYSHAQNRLETFFNKYKGLTLQSKMMSLTSVIAKEIPDLFFIGFYIVKQKNPNAEIPIKNEGQSVEDFMKQNYVLEVGPYISTILATPLIEYGKGVCGTAWKLKKTQVVADVKLIQNYIACDEETQSEIVLPVFSQTNPTEVIAVLDIDSEKLNRFTLADRMFFENILSYLHKE